MRYPATYLATLFLALTAAGSAFGAPSTGGDTRPGTITFGRDAGAAPMSDLRHGRPDGGRDHHFRPGFPADRRFGGDPHRFRGHDRHFHGRDYRDHRRFGIHDRYPFDRGRHPLDHHRRFLHERHRSPGGYGPGTVVCYRSGSALICYGG